MGVFIVQGSQLRLVVRKRSFLFLETQQSGAYFLSEPQPIEQEKLTLVTIKAGSPRFVLIE